MPLAGSVMVAAKVLVGLYAEADERHAGGSEVAKVGSGDADAAGEVGAVAKGVDGVEVAIESDCGFVQDVRRKDMRLRESNVAGAGAEVGGAGEGAL